MQHNDAARIVPIAIGAVTSVAGALVDINYGAIAAGITIVGTASAAAYWQLVSNRTRAFRESEAAKLEAYRNAERAKLELQKERDDLNKTSLSAQLDQLISQGAETNRRLEDARALAAQQAAIIASQNDLQKESRKRIEDANIHLHDVLDELNGRKLQHEAETDDLRRRLDATTEQLRTANDRLTAMHQDAADLAEKAACKWVETEAKVDRNTAAIEEIKADG